MKPSFETQAEKKMYERGRSDSIEELFKLYYSQLAERDAFPDKNPEAFIEWALEVLMPHMEKYRGQDDLFTQLMNS